jgi:hypothetical protein
LELAGLREEVAFVSVEFRLSEHTACKLLGVERSSYRYEPRPDRNIALREQLVKLARQKPRYGYRGQVNSVAAFHCNQQSGDNRSRHGAEVRPSGLAKYSNRWD